MPRAPLPDTSVTCDRVASSTTSKGITPSSSLLRAHAPNQLPPLDFVVPHLFPVVLAGCCEPSAGNWFFPTLFCQSFPGCLSHDPVGLQGAFTCYFPYISGLPQEVQWVGFPEVSPQRDFMWDEFRDRRYSLRSGLLVCSPPRSPLPLRPNRLAGQP